MCNVRAEQKKHSELNYNFHGIDVRNKLQILEAKLINYMKNF